LMERRQRAFDDLARPPEATAMSSPAFGQLRLHPEAVESVAVGLRIVATVALHEARLSQRPARAAAQRRNAFYERQQLRHVVPVRRCEARDNRNPVGVGKNVMLRPGLTAIGRVRSSFSPRAARGWKNCRPGHAPNRVGPAGAIRRAGRHGAGATPQRVASAPDATSRSCAIHSPFPWAASATGGRSATRRGCRLTPRGPRHGAAPWL
jgi:hypothetical protein